MASASDVMALGAPRAYPINRIGDLRDGSLTKANAYHTGCIHVAFR